MSNADQTGTALTIGNFDGVHNGHCALVRRCREMVGAKGQVIALAFSPHPMELLNPEQAPSSVESFQVRCERLQMVGADEVIQLVPTPELLSMSAQEFVDFVIDRYEPSVIVEGTDFRFGKRRSGNPTVLKELASLRGVEVQVVPAVEVALTDQSIVKASSTIVRWLIAHGRVRDAGFVLGRPHELVAPVVEGDQLGRQIGFRTANLDTESMLPCDGVYGVTAVLPNGEEFGGAMNIGTRPTVDGKTRRAEVHIFDYDGNPWIPNDGFPEYGWEIRVKLIGWIRDQFKFASVDALSEQLSRDVQRAKQMVEPLRVGIS
ncbi:MAG: riboflavin biosynthesis protein RibF [Phycisphaerales bacterium]|nr:riboflavin biosynthesis protein RibF [Phycisphaerales bacterium]